MENVALRRTFIAFGAAALAAPMLALALFNAAPQLDPLWMQFDVHFWVVGGIAVGAAIACAIIVASAPTLRETRLLFLALAFISVGGIFSIHGLMTPGYMVHSFYLTVPLSGWISIIVAAVFAALSAVDLPRPIDAFVRRAGIAILAWGLVGIGAYMLLCFEAGHWLDWIPASDRRFQYALSLGSMALFAFAIQRYWQAYLFARLPSQLAMVVALILLFEVAAMLLWGQVWHWSWWMYHATYAAAFVVLFAGWAIEVRRAGSLSVIADALAMRDALAQLNRGRDAHVLELVDAIETKDVATLGHVSRVAAYALAIGKKMSLSASDLRALVLSAQMHDVGKIGVPDAILRKPAALTDEEYAEIKKHSPRGFEIARRVEALHAVAPVIRAHHERLNGEGYPDGLRGDEIPLLARIIAVADTYDAMTSTRPYRAALIHDEAVAELRRVTGSELDQRCVAAFLASFEDTSLATAA
jgi:HD-GYP domain-containing protein (c-di-GMP phosphodiesterase class II)